MARKKSGTTPSGESEATPVQERVQSPEAPAAPATENEAPADYSLDESSDGGPPQVGRPAPVSDKAPSVPSDASTEPDGGSDGPKPGDGPTALLDAMGAGLGITASPVAPATESTFQKEEPKPGEEAAQRDPARVPDEGEQAANLRIFDQTGDTAPTQAQEPIVTAPQFATADGSERPRTFTVLRNVSVYKPGSVVTMEMLGIKPEHLPRLIESGTLSEIDPR